MSFVRWLLPLSLFPAVSTWADPEAGSPVRSDWGFFYRAGVDVDGREWRQAAGPFWEERRAGAQQTFRALRPLFAWSEHLARQATEWEVLYPMAGGFTLREALYQRVLLAWRKIADVNNPASPRRLAIFPFWFQGISRDGQPYRALFPLGGTLRDFLARDEVGFFLFPLRAWSSINGVRSDGWLWPIYSRSTGKGLGRFRVFPFYGETRFKDQFEKRFVLWPFWTQARYHLRGSEGFAWILWPLFGRVELADQRTTYLLPPLIRFSSGEAEARTHFLWPLYQHSTGSVEKTYFFPLWGTKTIGNLTRTFWLWPLGLRSRTEAVGETREHAHFSPFWHRADITPAAGTTGRVVVAREIWPLFSYRREDDRSRWRALELWPGREPPAVERNWSPLVSLFTRERRGDAVDTEVLWGLLRLSRRGETFSHTSLFPLFEHQRQSGPEGPVRRLSLLKGFFETERTAAGRSFRVLYFLKF
jgi:hypothetical protein